MSSSVTIKIAPGATASENPDDPFQYIISVRSLCELTAKEGDLDLRFTPSPTALEGMAGHFIVTSRRGYDYQTEITLTGEHGEVALAERLLDELVTIIRTGQGVTVETVERVLHMLRAETTDSRPP